MRLESFLPSMVGRDPIYSAGRVIKTAASTSKYIWALALADNDKHDGVTTSICEEAMSRFSESDDSLGGLIERHAIRVRDFMLLSLLCDQESFDIGQLERAMGLEPEVLEKSINRLAGAGFVKHNGVASNIPEVRTTAAGRILAQRILDGVE